MLLVLVLLVTGGQARRGRAGEAREVRAVVPQLLPNYTASTLPPAHQVRRFNTAGSLVHDYEPSLNLRLKL